MFIIWGNDNLSKILGKLERVPWSLPENWHGMALSSCVACQGLVNRLLPSLTPPHGEVICNWRLICTSWFITTTKGNTISLRQPCLQRFTHCTARHPQPCVATLGWCCIKYAIHHEQDVHEMAQTINNRVIAVCDLYCFLLPQSVWRLPRLLHRLCNRNTWNRSQLLTVKKRFIVFWTLKPCSLKAVAIRQPWDLHFWGLICPPTVKCNTRQVCTRLHYNC